MSTPHTQFELVVAFMRRHSIVLPSRIICNFRRLPADEIYTHSFMPGVTSDGITDGAVSYVILGGEVKYVSNDSLIKVVREREHTPRTTAVKHSRPSSAIPKYDVDEI